MTPSSSAAAPPPSGSRERYSPYRRTAVVLTGTGTAGAYHAGVLRALHEAGVKVDLMAGRGVGTVGALFGAVDGADQLWERTGLWAAPGATRLYRWRPALVAATAILGAALATLLLPFGVVVLATLVYAIAYFVQMVGLNGGWLTSGFGRLVEWVFAPDMLPVWLPRVTVVALALLLGALVCSAVLTWYRTRPGRRGRGAFWWLLAGAPLDADYGQRWFGNGLWKSVRGASAMARPSPEQLGLRYTRLLSDSLGQPGFRELLVAVHDLDGSRDLVLAMLTKKFRGPFFRRRGAGGDRPLEALDLSGWAARHGFDALAASLGLPVVTEPWFVQFPATSSWRGETHRLCDRPDALGRLLDEVALAGVQQVILVSAQPPPSGPHALGGQRRDGRGRMGESLQSVETAAARDAVGNRARLFQAFFEIRPLHNPLGPFDFAGSYDERSDRRWTLTDLMDRGFDDGYRQFVNPVVAPSGEEMPPTPRPRPPTPVTPVS
jgi:hypothetical protein